jgi:hypothetical protein
MDCSNFIEKAAQPPHLLQKGFALLRLDAQRIDPHQVIERCRRQSIHAGAAFVKAGIYSQLNITVAQQDRCGLPCARKLGSICVGEMHCAQSFGSLAGLRPAARGQVDDAARIIVDLMDDIAFALAVADQKYLHLKYFCAS